MKTHTRFTCEIPNELHRQLKIQCAMQGTNMTDVMRVLLEREFGRMAISVTRTKTRVKPPILREEANA
jgi:hypothetical protein